jgi:NADPH-dependent 2,4-dienoyl-CoA reductase/sulfur reductase-like enzyme
VYAAGDVALAYNVTAGRRIPSEHWRDATQQGRIAGTVAAGYPAAWSDVPEFTCAIGKYELTYRGWGTCHQDCAVVDSRDGFTATYRSGHEVVGVLTATANPAA